MPPKTEDKNGDKNKTTEERLDGLTKAFGDMSSVLNDLPKQIGASVTGSIRGLMEEGRSQQQADQMDDDNEDDNPMPTGDELEKLTRADFANHMADQFGKVLDKKLKPFQESLSTTIEANERDKVGAKFNDARSAHSDFDSWRDEMGELVKTRGYLDPEELYILVRAQNPEKTKQIDEGITKEKEETDKKDQEEASTKGQDKPTFLGLMPTSGATGEGEPQHKTSKEAATAAFDEIMGGIPESLIGEPVQT